MLQTQRVDRSSVGVLGTSPAKAGSATHQGWDC